MTTYFAGTVKKWLIVLKFRKAKTYCKFILFLLKLTMLFSNFLENSNRHKTKLLDSVFVDVALVELRNRLLRNLTTRLLSTRTENCITMSLLSWRISWKSLQT